MTSPLAATAAATAAADIHYRVQALDVDAHLFSVQLHIARPAFVVLPLVAWLLACISRSTCQFITARPHMTGSTPTTQGKSVRQLSAARRLAVRGMLT